MTTRRFILPPTAAGSLGDEAVVRGCLAGLENYSGGSSVLEIGPPWYADELGLPTTAAHFRVPSAKIRSATNRVRRAFAERLANDIYVPSTDILDGFYGEQVMLDRLEHLSRLSNRGTRVHFIGFSWNSAPPSVIDALRGVPEARFSTRDALSHDRFQTDTGLIADQGSDLAYLVNQHEPPPAETTALLSTWRDSGRQIVGITPNALWSTRYPQLNRSLAEMITHPALQEACFVLVPHDSRAGQDDHALARSISNIAGRGVADRVIVFKTRSYLSGRGVLALVDLHVAGRMHSGISAMSMGTPAIMLSLQDKVLGVLADANQQGMSISPGDAESTENLVKVVCDRLTETEARRESLNQQLASIRQRALMGLTGNDEVSHG